MSISFSTVSSFQDFQVSPGFRFPLPRKQLPIITFSGSEDHLSRSIPSFSPEAIEQARSTRLWLDKVGFLWKEGDPSEPIRNLAEETSELMVELNKALRGNPDPKALQDELADYIFTAVCIGFWMKAELKEIMAQNNTHIPFPTTLPESVEVLKTQTTRFIEQLQATPQDRSTVSQLLGVLLNVSGKIASDVGISPEEALLYASNKMDCRLILTERRLRKKYGDYIGDLPYSLSLIRPYWAQAKRLLKRLLSQNVNQLGLTRPPSKSS